MASHEDRAADLLDERGTTYASDAGIRVQDKPAALYKLLVLSILLSARIGSQIATRSARCLWEAGWTTPDKLADSSWEERVSALNEGGYTRYQERTATMLADAVEHLLDEYGGDLRNLREAAGRDPAEERERLKRFKGLGDTGVDIFFREVQDVWEEVAPFFDDRARKGAAKADLPKDADRLGRLVDEGDRARLSAALVREERGE